jgi:hypothetical protein
MVTVSPALTGLNSVTLPLELNTIKMPGSCANKITFVAVLLALPFATTRSTEVTSGSSNGTWTLIWVGEM